MVDWGNGGDSAVCEGGGYGGGVALLAFCGGDGCVGGQVQLIGGGGGGEVVMVVGELRTCQTPSHSPLPPYTHLYSPNTHAAHPTLVNAAGDARQVTLSLVNQRSPPQGDHTEEMPCNLSWSCLLLAPALAPPCPALLCAALIFPVLHCLT